MSNFHNSLPSIKRSSKAPGRSNFVNTCNLLSKYLKEKGGLKDLNREIIEKLEFRGKPETSKVKAGTTKDLLSIMEDLNGPPTEHEQEQEQEQAKSQDDELHMFEHMPSSTNPQNPINKLTISKDATKEPKNAKMTILYDGKVWVFDGLSPDKAGEVMLLASKGSSRWSGGNVLTVSPDKITPAGAIASNSAAPFSPEKQHVQPQLDDANTSDLPIARRSSLHRFLAKRKDRATAKGPYQVQNAPASSSKSDDQRLNLSL